MTPLPKVKACANEYTCANCGKQFDGAWSDEEANAEAESYFGVKDAANDKRFVVVCDDCFRKMHPKDHPKLVDQAKEFGGRYV